MNEQVVIMLKKLITENGTNICYNKMKLQGFLSDLCGESKKEINLIITAQQQNIAQELLNVPEKSIDDSTYFRLVNRLCDEVGIAKDNSEWVVKTWAEAVGKEISNDVSKLNTEDKTELKRNNEVQHKQIDVHSDFLYDKASVNKSLEEDNDEYNIDENTVEIRENEKRGMAKSILSVLLIAITLFVVHKATIFMNSNDQQSKNSLTVSISKGNTTGNIANYGFVAKQNDWIYYQSTDGYKLYKMKADGSSRQKINDDYTWYINVSGDWIYYGNRSDNYKLYKIKIDGSGRQKLNDDESLDINLEGDWIYYNIHSDKSYGGQLYKIKIDGSSRQKISDDMLWNINICGDWIYYNNSSDGYKLYKIKKDGSGRQKLNDDKPSDMNLVGGWIYYRNTSDNDKPYKIKIDGSGRQKINDDEAWFLNVAGDWIYYANSSDKGKLYKVKTDGSKKQKLNEDLTFSISIVDDWIYYTNFRDDDKIYRIKIDGTSRKLVE